MNNVPPLREIDVRRAIMKLKINNLPKLVLLATLDRVDWLTMSGLVSSTAIANTLNHNRRTVVRALTILKSNGYIDRDSHKTSTVLNTISITSLNISLIMGRNSDVKSLPSSDVKSLPLVTSGHLSSDDRSLPPSDVKSHNQGNYNYINNDQLIIKDENTSTMSKRQRLTDEQIEGIEIECHHQNDYSHQSRVLIARRLYKIRLLKGGYFERI